MSTKMLPLKEMSIYEIYNGDKATYEVPIYQRNYAWEKEEIFTLIQDIYDAFIVKKPIYFIGTLVSFHKGDQVYEIIDGQQRLTTIYLVLGALRASIQNKLTYRARKKSSDTLKNMPDFKVDEKDYGIVNGFRYADDAINQLVSGEEVEEFKNYFQNSVHLIHYQVPKDIDLNHYFEIMNSRGEQLEKPEIIKARLLQKLNKQDKAKFNLLWECCSEMNVYVQQKYYSRDKNSARIIFGNSFDWLYCENFDNLPETEDSPKAKTIRQLLESEETENQPREEKRIDSFQPIIDFSNFLLIVLKLTRMEEQDFEPTDFNLDDKELLSEFEKVKINEEFVKTFSYNLLLAKFLLDNFMVHHSNEEDTIENNPWKLQCWQKKGKKEQLKNLSSKADVQNKLVHLLSMFEVSFTARQRKNYLFYCLLYLFYAETWEVEDYLDFVSELANKYFKDVYLDADNLNERNTPKPGSFDDVILWENELNIEVYNDKADFLEIYGDGTDKSKGIPLFVFNYLDYKLWEKYANDFRGKKTKESSQERKMFFEELGCSDFGLKFFEQFYFSRTRRSLEHYYPQANANGKSGAPTEENINCLGNYAMIGSEANSSGSNWSPKAKLDHYLDASGKIRQISVASLKFMIMMQQCKDNQNMMREAGLEWTYKDITEHQQKMLQILFDD